MTLVGRHTLAQAFIFSNGLLEALSCQRLDIRQSDIDQSNSGSTGYSTRDIGNSIMEDPVFFVDWLIMSSYSIGCFDDPALVNCYVHNNRTWAHLFDHIVGH